MIQSGRLLNNVVAFFVVCLLMAGCAPARKFATDPIYDVGRYRTETRQSTKNQSGQTSKKETSKSSQKMDASSAALVAEARKWIGTPYRYGGHSRSGTDCSGFIMEVFRAAAGIELPRTSRDQRKYAANIKFNELEVGDLVFFSTKGSSGDVSHVGLYIGDNNMIHASTSRGVMISGLGEKYYVNTYHSSGRVAKFKSKSSSGGAVSETKSQSTTTKGSATTQTSTQTPPKLPTGDDVKKTVKESVKTALKSAVTKAKSPKKKTTKESKKKTVKQTATQKATAVPKYVKEVKHTDLDSILNMKVDSVFTGMFD